MKKAIYRLSAVLLTGIMLCTSALAATVTANTAVNVRSGPDNECPVVCVMPQNAVAEKLGVFGNWYEVEYQGKTGYVYKKYLTDNETASAKTVYVTASSLNVRSAPNTSASKIGSLKKGDAVQVTALKDGWYTIDYNGQTGYISAEYTSETAPSSGGYQPTTIYITADTVTVYSAPKTSAEKLDTLKKGTAVTATALVDGWYTIQYNDTTGFIQSAYASKTKPSTPAEQVTTVYVTASSLNVRSTPSTSGAKLGSLTKGTAVDTYGLNDGWYTIKYNGQTAYISAQYTSKTAPSTPTEQVTTVYVTASSLNVRSAPSTSGAKLGSLTKGTAVDTYGLNNGWYTIKYNGRQTAYISAQYTTKTAPSAPTEQTTTVYITASSLNVRSTPSTNGAKLGSLKKGTAVDTYGLDNGWYTIKYNGQTAYISAQYTSKTPN